ncbi:pimeloyl-ACP methyl ester carboxylesterase [Nocardia transvalensis]|uniref:Pimeloyl-ACP methyl ester carboxylesterase n=1 Tax=Nocardia transvalensis TaxID=37333 RepID=A0A7W9ULL7_9NOCA|nr:alpha/beta hydrolase [Nocardia transvalensis]MBB5917674.1 pimeloyl-ACP methyl ester carboxylesterase [Nocardia transvalensis]
MTELAAALGVDIHDPTPPRDIHYSRTGCRLHGFDWGGEGFPVFLLHGGKLSAHTWDFVSLGLRGTVRPIALDLRGHGDSDWSGDYRVATMAADVAAAADHLGIDRFALAGMSLGGVVAAHVAGTWPDRVHRLALIDVAPGVDFDSTRRMREFTLGLGAVGSLDTVVDAALRLNPRADRASVAYRMHTLFRPTPEGEWIPKADPSPPDFPAILAAIHRLTTQLTRHPVLLIRGARSKVLPQLAAEQLVDRIPHGELVVVPNAGHNVQEDNPAALTIALRAFLTPRQ